MICAADHRPLCILLHAVGFANILGAPAAGQVAPCPGKQRIGASRFKSPMQACNDCLHMIKLACNTAISSVEVRALPDDRTASAILGSFIRLEQQDQHRCVLLGQ